MEKTKFERGKSLTYPHYFPTLTFTPIFGRRGDFVWVEEVKGAWPEYDSEFTFVRSTVHDQRVDSLKAENAKLRELVRQWYPHMLKRVGRDALKQWGQMDVVKELGIEVGP